MSCNQNKAVHQRLKSGLFGSTYLYVITVSELIAVKIKNRRNRISAFLILLLFFLITGRGNAQIEFSYHSNYRYLKGKDAASLPGSWKDASFDDTSWLQGNAPFRYGDGAYGVELTDMLNSYTTLYMRSTFECTAVDQLKDVIFSVDYDDGFIIWINGTEALRVNAPSTPAYNSTAPANHESGVGEDFIIYSTSLNLMEGSNLITVQAFNVSTSSSDFYFDLSVFAEKHLPEVIDTIGIDFSVPSGFYDEPFDVVLTSPDPALQIIYTLDGSNPQKPATSFTRNSPVTITIDPAGTEGRTLTPGVVLRASLVSEGLKPSKPSSRSYIFPEKVKNQSWPGEGWPTAPVNGQLIDLEMDNEIVNNPEYLSLIEDALLDIPTISITTDLKNLFDPLSGIYVNADGHGLGWEKECGVELINPDGSPGFGVNAGLRIRGGWSRHDDFPKHSLRLFFREKYGTDKLDFPLFGDEGADQYDKIDLRTEQNYAWSTGSSYNSFVREVFSRDSQRDMGQPYTRSRYYHLYLNGMYWGLYQTQERSEARFASTYLGGDDEDYDVVKVNVEDWSYNIEATDGNLDSWRRLWDLCAEGFSTNSNYFALEGKDQNGNPVKGGEIMVNIDNLIDYMMVIFYTGNFDAPSSSFFSNKGSNNFYAIDDRTDKSTGFTFYAHDSEHSLFDEPHSPGVGITEDRVNIADRTDNLVMQVNSFTSFHPQWLHYKLSENAEYRIRFAGRAYRHLKEGGVFDPVRALERINTRISEIDMAIIAESARWGDAKRSTGTPFTKNNNWIPEVNKIRNKFIPVRNFYVIGQLMAAGLYPDAMAPQIKTSGITVTSDDVILDEPVEIEIVNPNVSGILYYTLNGIDPRNTGGGIYTGALFGLDDIRMKISRSAVIIARVFVNGEWSAPEQVNFIDPDEDFSKFRITEIYYHPPDVFAGTDTITDGRDLEFIEFKNTGKDAINLTGLVLDSAVYHEFDRGKLLAPSQFYVIASKPSVFYDNYGLVASGNYKGNLSNGGEEILLSESNGEEVMRFFFQDSSPWPDGADGDGFSLSSEEANPAGDPADYEYWTLSYKPAGTPFADNIQTGPEPPGSLPDGSLSVYPNPTKGEVTVRLITNDEIYQARILLYDLTGKLVLDTTIGNPGMFDLNETGLPGGIYIMNVTAPGYSTRTRIILAR